MCASTSTARMLVRCRRGAIHARTTVRATTVCMRERYTPMVARRHGVRWPAMRHRAFAGPFARNLIATKLLTRRGMRDCSASPVLFRKSYSQSRLRPRRCRRRCSCCGLRKSFYGVATQLVAAIAAASIKIIRATFAPRSGRRAIFVRSTQQ
jgi:hypothetical protein